MSSDTLVAIYDFEFFPYALGDVLTWNVRTAMRCEELGRSQVDIYICLDEKYPASIYQRGLINPDNFELFFSELYGAFGTNPKFGNLFIFRKREAMLLRLQKVVAKDRENQEAFHDYLKVCNNRVSDTFINTMRLNFEKKARKNKLIRNLFHYLLPRRVRATVQNNLSLESILNGYFIKYIYSHEKINEFAAKHGRIPYLTSSVGCAPDVDEIIARQFAGKKIVPFHLRLRRLDVGYGGDHTYMRDSNFLEWFDFLRRANTKHPDVQFVALGRLQEKSLEMMRLPNVTSLRVYGMGLGHELTLMLKSDLFIGTSSGFAALANFSALPYFITRMNPGSCQAYAIEEGTEKLPFAKDNQRLVYADETSELLMSLLEEGLNLPAQESVHAKSDLIPSINDSASSQTIDLIQWLALHTNPTNTARTTCRFYIDEKYRRQETAFLLLPYLEEARIAFAKHEGDKAAAILTKLKENFADLPTIFPHFLLLEGGLAAEKNNFELLKLTLDQLDKLSLEDSLTKIKQLLKDCLADSFQSLSARTMENITQIKNQIGDINFIKV